MLVSKSTLKRLIFTENVGFSISSVLSVR